MTKTFVSVTKDFFKRFFEESSIHGFPYIVKKSIHICERIFWLIILLLSVLAAFYVFNDQYTRYKENPIVLTLEFVNSGYFAKPAVTICPIFDPETHNEEEDENDIYGKVLSEFHRTVIYSNISNLENFQKFENSTDYDSLNNIKLPSIIQHKFPELSTNAISNPQYYAKVITEVGICYTTSELYLLQSDERSKDIKKTKQRSCKFNVLCLEIASFKDSKAIEYRVVSMINQQILHHIYIYSRCVFAVFS